VAAPKMYPPPLTLFVSAMYPRTHVKATGHLAILRRILPLTQPDMQNPAPRLAGERGAGFATEGRA
jgi:hypothetical protein